MSTQLLIFHMQSEQYSAGGVEEGQHDAENGGDDENGGCWLLNNLKLELELNLKSYLIKKIRKKDENQSHSR